MYSYQSIHIKSEENSERTDERLEEPVMQQRCFCNEIQNVTYVSHTPISAVEQRRPFNKFPSGTSPVNCRRNTSAEPHVSPLPSKLSNQCCWSPLKLKQKATASKWALNPVLNQSN